jgi:hypothetical protein
MPHLWLESWCQRLVYLWPMPFPEDLTDITFPNLIDLTLPRITNYEEHPWCHDRGMSYSSELVHGKKLLLSSRLHQVTLPCKCHCIRLLDDPYNYVMDKLIITNAPSLEKVILQEQGNGPRIIQVMVAPKHEISDCLCTDMMSTMQIWMTIFLVTDQNHEFYSLHSIILNVF